MAKYKVLKTFRDVHTKEVYKPNIEIEMTTERAGEVEKTLGDSFLVCIDNEENKGNTEEEIEAVKAELESLGVSFHPNTGIEKLRIRLEKAKAEKENEE